MNFSFPAYLDMTHDFHSLHFNQSSLMILSLEWKINNQINNYSKITFWTASKSKKKLFAAPAQREKTWDREWNLYNKLFHGSHVILWLMLIYFVVFILYGHWPGKLFIQEHFHTVCNLHAISFAADFEMESRIRLTSMVCRSWCIGQSTKE